MPRRYVVSEFAIVSWHDGDVQITSPVSAKTFTYHDPSVLEVLSAFAVPRAVQSGDAAAWVDEWIAASILVDADVPEPAALHHWDRESLALHVSSRNGAWRKKPGPTTTPAVAPQRSEDTIPLAPGPAFHGGDLAALLDARRSRRSWANKPIDFQTFSNLLWMSARNRAAEGQDYVSRPYPSGGAAYSLELYPVVANEAVEALPSGIYRYLPEAHALEVVAPSGVESRRILAAAGTAIGTTAPPVAILITSRYARQSEQYGAIAYSLVLKEVGCLFQTLYLAAESFGLAACALGGGTPAGLLAKVCRTTELEEPVVGELAIGAAAD